MLSRKHYDQASTSPPLGTGYMYMYPHFAEEAGTTRDPKLSLTYTYYPAPVGSIQDIYYTYDAVGNITKIVNNSATDATATTTYTYDDLHRLLSASTTEAVNNANYKRTYTYNWLGNMTNGDKGAYAYTGNSGFNYANPHAATLIGSLTYTYDKNGNVLTSASSTNTWDYRNRLATTVIGTTTTTYKYDNNDERITLFDQLGTTTFPFPFYSVRTSTSTPWVYYKQIYANGDLVATIKGSTTTAAVYYVHNDHLGGTDIVSNTSGTIEQEFSYYPFGSTRVSKKLGTFSESRRYIGQEYDSGTNLSYLHARYYEPVTAKFWSEDPVFWREPNKQNLNDPQSLNSYSYANNNPITKKDWDGLAATVAQQIQVLQAQINILQGIVNLYVTGFSQQGKSAFSAYQTAFGGGQSGAQQGKGSISTWRSNSTGGTPQVPNITASLNKDMQAHAADLRINNPFYFKKMVLSTWDLKNTPEYNSSTYGLGFVFNGQHVRSDAPGNIHYGYVGAAALWDQLPVIGGPQLLLQKAGENQVQNNLSQREWQNSNFYGDDPVDQINSLWGINLYYNR